MKGDFLKLVKKRKITYEFSDKKVKASNVKKILDSARWAPSSHNCQDWKFIVVRDKKMITNLLDTCYYGELLKTLNSWNKMAL